MGQEVTKVDHRQNTKNGVRLVISNTTSEVDINNDPLIKELQALPKINSRKVIRGEQWRHFFQKSTRSQPQIEVETEWMIQEDPLFNVLNSFQQHLENCGRVILEQQIRLCQKIQFMHSLAQKVCQSFVHFRTKTKYEQNQISLLVRNVHSHMEKTGESLELLQKKLSDLQPLLKHNSSMEAYHLGLMQNDQFEDIKNLQQYVFGPLIPELNEDEKVSEVK